jgi:hypothetical protein
VPFVEYACLHAEDVAGAPSAFIADTAWAGLYWSRRRRSGDLAFPPGVLGPNHWCASSLRPQLSVMARCPSSELRSALWLRRLCPWRVGETIGGCRHASRCPNASQRSGVSVGRGSRALGLQSGEGAPQREQTSALQRALPRPLFPSPGLCSLSSVLLEQPQQRGLLGLAVASYNLALPARPVRIRRGPSRHDQCA